MKRKILYGLWIYLYILCSVLGHIAAPSAALAVWMRIAAVLFFLPGGLLLWDAIAQENAKGIRLIRRISLASLALTMVALIANIAAVNAPQLAGNILHVVLIWVSAPMLCSGLWALSLFLWGCLLFASFLKKPKA